MTFYEGDTTLGERVPIGSYGSYSEAQEAVDLLSDKGLPVERDTIVGTGLRYVEQVAGRVTTARAALAGAAEGVFLGLVFALLLGLFFTVRGAFFAVLVYGVLLGAVLGALLGAVTHAGMGGRRDFASVAGMAADRYEVMADSEIAKQARRVLSEKLPARTKAAT